MFFQTRPVSRFDLYDNTNIDLYTQNYAHVDILLKK